jgi:hypothetical protein
MSYSGWPPEPQGSGDAVWRRLLDIMNAGALLFLPKKQKPTQRYTDLLFSQVKKHHEQSETQEKNTCLSFEG